VVQEWLRPLSFTIKVVLTLLQIRYHPNFKGEDTLLFAGSRDDIDFVAFLLLRMEWRRTRPDWIPANAR